MSAPLPPPRTWRSLRAPRRAALALVAGALVVASPLATRPAAAVSPAPQRALVPVLPPVATRPADAELALIIQAKASALLVATGRYHDVNLKQILSMDRRERLAAGALAERASAEHAARLLGSLPTPTPRVAFGTLAPAAGGGWTLDVTATTGTAGAPRRAKIALPAGYAEAARVAAQGTAALVASIDGVKVPADAAPSTRSDAALRAYAVCHAVLVRQPIGIENPTVLHADEIARALEACRSALREDPGLAPARAALSLALALRGEDQAAVKELAAVNEAGAYLPFYWIARFWLVTRYQSNEAGERLLRQAIASHPYFLLARGYLAELLDATRRAPEALAAWQDYQAVAPGSPFVLARIGRTLARLGRHDEAVARTEAARALSGGGPQIDLELASRFVDAGRLERAEALLAPLAAAPNARGEIVLRLGYVRLLRGQLAEAEALLKRAVAAAAGPTEWKTRGRARWDLAKIYVRRQKPDLAEAALLQALEEGYRPFKLGEADRELDELAARAERRRSAAANPAGGSKLAKLDLSARPPTASPFSLDGAGEIDPGRPKPPPPTGFEVIRFQ